jgi:hypothetical protein
MPAARGRRARPGATGPQTPGRAARCGPCRRPRRTFRPPLPARSPRPRPILTSSLRCLPRRSFNRPGWRPFIRTILPRCQTHPGSTGFIPPT